MHSPKDEAWFGDVVQQAVEIANAQANGAVTRVHPLTIVVCDVDIPVIVANGEVYVQTTLQGFHDAVSAQMVEFLRRMETRISEARSSALAFADSYPELGIEAVDLAHLVRDRREQ